MTPQRISVLALLLGACTSGLVDNGEDQGRGSSTPGHDLTRSDGGAGTGSGATSGSGVVPGSSSPSSGAGASSSSGPGSSSSAPSPRQALCPTD